MSWLQNLSIGRRLMLAFATLIALMMVLTAVGVQRVRIIEANLTQINDINSVKQRHAIDQRGSVHDRAIALRDVVLLPAGAEREQALALIDRLAADYDKATVALRAQLRSSDDAEEKRQFAAIEAIARDIAPTVQQVRALRAQDDAEAATALLLGKARPAFVQWLGAINALIDHEEQKNRAAADRAASTARAFSYLMIVLTVLALVLGTAIALLLTRSVVRPLQQSLRLAQRIGGGDLGADVAIAGRDECAQLLRAMATMQERLREVIAAQAGMAARHAEGQISYRMDATALPGQFGQMVADTNALVDAHVRTEMTIAEVMGRYAVGDLSPDMPSYPGEKARLSQTVQQAKQNLVSISADIGELSQAARDGDFSHRGVAEGYAFTFKDIIDNLNGMMATADASLGALSTVLQAIARGELTGRMDEAAAGVFGQMSRHSNTTVAQLTQMIGQIQRGARRIDEAAADIAQGNGDLSARTEAQTACLDDTTASIRTLASAVQHNARLAQQANGLSLAATDVATAGRRATHDVVEMMQRIEASSLRIADITAVIDGIAFQTNILALNAAVEAARAGEHGQGFAVVAGEVRTLAQRSAAAAREIRTLIVDANGQVAEGSALVERAGQTMEQIVDSVDRVRAMIGDIATSSQAQSGDIARVDEGLDRLAGMNTLNSQLADVAADAARSMKEEAVQLSDAVSVFTLEAGTPATRQRPLGAAA
ncbi:methyl-accepting chemotaxis protein [Stenotrophomonas sp. 24(2023)]|uniref:methyl-accepting chemotaxis protein n=1 Tax=Stenotrophomonas sp. 24(2023) TaxID=3068324 RepID=UPI0027E0551B|nr:methyl-accepting chemotaxis protein [Stenotrophomonas sp. 24(2023)]WMJ71459.1 methyl-accepting chemotaxis protein [Stenotrophomonas sp. 24(2023)]